MRRWRKDLLDAEVSAVTAAKAYRLLKAILNTAVDDGMIRRNPNAGAHRRPSPRLCAPSAPTSSAHVSRRRIVKPKERTGANRSAQATAAVSRARIPSRIYRVKSRLHISGSAARSGETAARAKQNRRRRRGVVAMAVAIVRASPSPYDRHARTARTSDDRWRLPPASFREACLIL